MEKQAFQLLMGRLDKLEVKVDKLLEFKYWVIGVGGTMSVFISLAVNYLIQ